MFLISTWECTILNWELTDKLIAVLRGYISRNTRQLRSQDGREAEKNKMQIYNKVKRL